MLSTNVTSDSKFFAVDHKALERLDNFFQGFSFETRFMMLEYLSDEIYKLAAVSRRWRKAVKELLLTAATETAKRFVSKNKEFIAQYSVDLRFITTARVNRVDLLINLRFAEALKNHRVSIEYSYKQLNSAEPNYCTFEFNLTDSPQNRFYVFYEHSRLHNQNSSLWSSVNHNYSSRSTISLPVILGSRDEFLNLRSVHWRKIRIGAPKPPSLFEAEMTRGFKNFEWKPIKNKYLGQLLPTAQLQANFLTLNTAYYGMDTVILKGEYVANKRGKIMIIDESDSKNSLKVNVFEANEQHRVVNMMKPRDIIKDVEETLNLCEKDVLVFYIKKNFDAY